jgi:rare lipoprotein A
MWTLAIMRRRKIAALALAGAAVAAAGILVPAYANADEPTSQECVSSWYGAPGEIPDGWPTASGEPFDPNALAAASRTLPFGTQVRVTNLANGKSVDVHINDRGPFMDPDHRCIDLTRGSFEQIGSLDDGLINVRVDILS